MRQVVLDTETTGLDWNRGHRVVEIGCIELLERRPTGRRFQRYLNPERDIDAGAQEVTGLTREFLADKPLFAQVALARGQQALPQVLVLHRIAAAGAPAASHPVRQPLKDTLPDVLRIGPQQHGAGSRQCLERRDRRHQLHPVVGGVQLAAGQLALARIEAQQGGPATGAGISQAGAVGADLHPALGVRGHPTRMPCSNATGAIGRTGVTARRRLRACTR